MIMYFEDITNPEKCLFRNRNSFKPVCYLKSEVISWEKVIF